MAAPVSSSMQSNWLTSNGICIGDVDVLPTACNCRYSSPESLSASAVTHLVLKRRGRPPLPGLWVLRIGSCGFLADLQTVAICPRFPQLWHSASRNLQSF